MLKNPYMNAVYAAGYITLLIFGLQNIIKYGQDFPETLLLPLTMLSLLVLSVALMGVLFFYQPARLYFDGQKDEVLPFIFKSLGAFIGCILVFIALNLLVALSV